MAASNIEEEPLDPEVEAIRRKLVRLLMVSGGIMFVGLMTVLIAIVYKINQGTEAVATAPASASQVLLPNGSKILDSAIDGNSVMLTLQEPDGSKSVHVYVNGVLKTQFLTK